MQVHSATPFMTRVIQAAFNLFIDVNRSVKVVIKNYSSLVLSNCTQYPHHGTFIDNIQSSVGLEGSSEMEFKKTNVVFFGVSGYFEYTLEKASKKRRIIVVFSAPMRGGTNTVSVTSLDEGDRKFVDQGASTYTSLKNNMAAKIRKKMKSEVFFESSPVKGVCTNPSIDDNIINVRVKCSINGKSRATLKVTVKNL